MVDKKKRYHYSSDTWMLKADNTISQMTNSQSKAPANSKQQCMHASNNLINRPMRGKARCQASHSLAEMP